MAAPILSRKQQAACLAKKANKSKKKKAQLKNVLLGESVSRPKASQQVEDVILLRLSDVLKGLPNVFKPVKSDSKKDQEAKRKVRAQLDLGTNCVCRSLEKDRLACVLVSGKVTPAPALDHVIALAQQKGCPLLCLDALSITLAKVTKSKCLPICIGFKRPNTSGGLADFVDVISLVQKHTTVSKRTLKELNARKTLVAKRTSLPESLRPVTLDASTDEAVREELKKIFANAAINQVENRMMTPKEKKRKKNKIKQTKTYYRQWFHKQFESGKKTVAQFVAAGKIQLVLVIPQLLPVLMAESASTSLLCFARDQNCPVLVVSNLSMVMSPDPANKLAILGIKRETSLPADTHSTFRPVIDICLNFMRTAPMPSQDMDVECAVLPDNNKQDNSCDQPNPGDEDYSFLYVLKKDSIELKEKSLKLKEEEVNASKQMAFSGDFISFGDSGSTGSASESGSLLGKRKSEKPLKSALMRPKKMNLDTQNEVDSVMDSVVTETNAQKDNTSSPIPGGKSNKNDSVSSIFSVNRGGDQSNKSRLTHVSQSALSSSSSTVLGMETLEESASTQRKEDADNVTNIFTASTGKAKGEEKKRHGQDGFLSFGYTEANIHTMVANPERKKKKKGKR